MSDQDVRRYERQAATGDVEAGAKLLRAWVRTHVCQHRVACLYCEGTGGRRNEFACGDCTNGTVRLSPCPLCGDLSYHQRVRLAALCGEPRAQHLVGPASRRFGAWLDRLDGYPLMRAAVASSLVALEEYCFHWCIPSDHSACERPRAAIHAARVWVQRPGAKNRLTWSKALVNAVEGGSIPLWLPHTMLSNKIAVRDATHLADEDTVRKAVEKELVQWTIS